MSSSLMLSSYYRPGQYGLSCHSCGTVPHRNDCPLTHDLPSHNGSMISYGYFCMAAAVPLSALALFACHIESEKDENSITFPATEYYLQ